ncbi:MAG: O-antigen ligase family protein, partial [Thermoanaerobaculia bacterium]
AFAVRRGELNIPVHPVYLPLAIYLAGSLISAAASYRPMKSLGDIGEWYTFLSFPLALALYRALPPLRRIGIFLFVFLGYFESLYGIFEYFVLDFNDLEHRITGTAGHVMTYSGIVLPISLVLIVFALATRNRWLTAGALLTTFALALTFTRGVWIGWTAGVVAIIVARGGRWRGYLIPATLILLVVMPLSLFGRFTSIFDTTQSSNFDRIRMLQGGAEMIGDYPLLGVGPSNVKEIYPLYRSSDAPRFRIPHLHNNVAQIWAERGLLSIFGYLLLVALLVRALWPRPGGSDAARAVDLAGTAAVVSLFVAGLFEYNFGDTEIQMTMLDLAALLIALREIDPPATAPSDLLPAARIESGI